MFPFGPSCPYWSSWFSWTSLPTCSSWGPFPYIAQSSLSLRHQWSYGIFCLTLPSFAHRSSLVLIFWCWKDGIFRCYSLSYGSTFLSCVCCLLKVPWLLYLSVAFPLWRASCIVVTLQGCSCSFVGSFRAACWFFPFQWAMNHWLQ